MKLKFNGILVLLVVLMAQLTFAQERAVTGVVSDNAGMPIPGVSVLVKGTKFGTQTDFDGKFAIKAAPSQILIFSYIGMLSQEVKATSTLVNVKMKSSAVELEGVVVTAFGIKRKPKQLGYSVSSVKTEDITESSEPDLVRSLQGKVAGVNVNVSTGAAGAANQITIRGISTFSGDIQPLIIVDGIAYNNTQVTTSNQVTGGGGYESALSSLDPNDIASVNVLKSAAAAALYGSRAVNGVIVITTKSGSLSTKQNKKLSVNFGSGVFLEQIANLPDYQNTYGAGVNFNYANANGSWGPRFDSRETIPTWPTLLAAFPTQFGPTVPYVAKPNNVKDLFRTGSIAENTIGLSYANQDGSFNVTISDLGQNGYIPSNTYDRTSFSAGGTFKLANKLTAGANMSYADTKQVGAFFGENQFGGSSSSFARTLFLARNWDLNLPYEDLTDGRSVTPNGTQFDHPLWSWKHDQITTNTTRTVVGLNLSYAFNDNINVFYRAGVNKYSLERAEIRDLYSRASGGLGSLVTDNFSNQDIESTLLVNFKYKLTDDIGLAAIVGNNILQNSNKRTQNEGTGFKVANIFNLGNVLTVVNNADSGSEKRSVGVFADVTFDYKEFLYINATGRNDWSSSLPKESNSYFYPSVSASFIITEALNMNSNILSFAKIRGGYGKVGRDASSEFINQTFNLGVAYNNTATIGNSTSLADPNIKPEFTEEVEVGADLEFFKRRVIVDVSLYKKTSTDLITPITVPTTSGFAQYNTNLGSIENKGVELALTLVPFRTKDFKWSLQTNYTKNENKVTKLIDGLERFPLRANAVGYVEVGQAYGFFYGTKFARDANGNFLIDKAGGVIQDPTPGYIGNPQADFRMAFINTFTYKGFSLKAQFDWKEGGDISSTTINTLLGRGVTKDTENRENTFIIPGFYGNTTTGTALLDASGAQIPNTTQLSMNELYFSPSNSNTFGINSVDEASVYDATVYRLSNVSLTYDFPAKFIDKTPFGSVSLSAIGNNLWYFAPNVPKYTNFDPDVTSLGSGTSQGIEIASAPTSKRFGIKLNLTF
ncbi:SusC/RagA family TonB-linked outer membrane protein [Flavobacterium sp. ALD4]|uniref:SusC/RagA family TonB-linked outer membrane protein n=1 Tax=Flavobacterium sp. ALD4 TaxID=2058314 RepID=UPI000C332895|nr:SusC/RagA family TonB-linked outer membrane protein [Flavobacterium sp. ALD4]PKH67594.1 SusC/RagA family TonB-linked outer membrane protein [Flavobacterium sp. ALD4]